jgi:hypothetical protein
MAADDHMPDLQGTPGELVERLVVAIDDADQWQEYAWHAVFAVGGKWLLTIEPDNGRIPLAGSVGAQLRRTHQLVSRASYMKALANRLEELVLTGLREDVLVRAVRNELERELAEQADMSGTNDRRASTKETLERRAADSDFLERFQVDNAGRDPTLANLTAEQMAEHLRDMADRLQPPPIEVTVDSWGRLQRWQERTATYVSDKTLARWVELRALRVTGGTT